MKKTILRLSIVAILATMMFSLTGCTKIIEGAVNAANNKIATAVEKLQQEIDAFNAKFEEYVGTYVKASKVKVLLTVVTSTNANGERTIKLTGDVKSAADVNDSKTYTVELSYDDDGAVNVVNITENK